MGHTWTVIDEPSNARITEKFSGWERVCNKIVEAKGCIVLDKISGPAAARATCTAKERGPRSCANATTRAHAYQSSPFTSL